MSTVTDIRSLPPGRYVAAHLPGRECAYIPYDDAAYPAARRLLDGKGKRGDEELIAAWMDDHAAGQLALWGNS